MIDPRRYPPGVNVALAALGGKVFSATSEDARAQWVATNLIDGGRAAWSSQNDEPQEIVLAFRGERQTTVTAVVIDTWTERTNMDSPQWYYLPKDVEVWVSTSSPTADFARVASARLTPLPLEQVIAFPPVQAKYVKIRFLHSRSYMVIGEIQVLEAPDVPSIVEDLPKNIALPALGGSIVRFTSQKAYRGRFGDPRGEMIGFLTDGGASSLGWVSEDDKLPQDVIFAFSNDAPGLIERIILNPKTSADPSTWVREFAVALSDHPLEGFRDVGTFTLANQPRDQSFTINREGRYLRLRILKNQGSARETSLGEVQVIEGSRPGYVSVLRRPAVATAALGTTQTVDETNVLSEAEPNNAPAQANALANGRRTRGRVEPLGEIDYFRFRVDRPGVLNLELLGRPTIRTSLTLQDDGGRLVKQWTPAQGAGARAEFSWKVNAGDRLFKVHEPPVSAVIAMDTSGSLSTEDLANLKEAIFAYVDEIQPTERYHLAWFSERVEVMTQEFTSDPTTLKSALGKLPTSGGTGTQLYDAIAKAVDLLRATSGNRAVIVMTDGEDVSSRLAYPAFWNLVARARIPIYAIGMGPELQNYEPILGTTPYRLLVHLANVTGGRFFFARSSEELKSLFHQVAEELRTPSTYYLRPTVSRGPGSLAVVSTGERIASLSAPGQIELILDASGSMKRRVEGRQMMDIAKDVLTQIIKELPDGARVALRVYGHRVREGRAGDCQDSQLLVPFGRLDKPRMIATVRRLQALGTTPIAYTLKQLPRDFGSAPGEKLVILVTDGKEECGGSPSAVASELIAKGIKIRLNIVGFALAEAATKQEMERVARLAGGRFFDAANARSLTQAIRQSLTVPFEVLDAAGEVVASGLTGAAAIHVPEGRYTVVVRAAGETVRVPNVHIAIQRFTKVVLRKEGREIGVQVAGP